VKVGKKRKQQKEKAGVGKIVNDKNGKKVEKEQSRRQISGHACIVDRLKRKFFSRGIFILLSLVLYTTMLHLPPLRFHCVGNRTQS
jgi:hypothetical protein